jgi:N-acetylglucosaminyl-diphospho-decaprenol L-rhamnosyltransferase
MNSMNQPPTCDLSIVIVSWNVWPLLKRCLASIERVSAPGEGGVRWLQRGGEGEAPNLQSAIYNLQSATLEVIVVDNASHDDTPAQIAAHFPWVRVIASDKNLGFTGGNNRGFAASHGRFIYFLNPDTELTYLQSPISQSLAYSLYAAITPDPTIGVIGPQLRYADGAPQPSARRFPTPWTGIFESTWLGRAWPSNPWARKLLMADWPADRAGEVDWLVGAALLCRREALDAVATPDGPFDEGFFMYSEELDLCRRIQQAGWRIVYEPTALVIHHEGKSSEQVSTQRHIRFNTSKVRYWRKWFGPRWGEALRRYLLLEYRVQIGVEQVKLWLGQKPALRRERIAAYRAVIESGLRAPETFTHATNNDKD